MKNILLYVIPNSKPCQEAESFLKERNIRFRAVDASKPELARELIEETKQLAVPTLIVDEEAVVGFEPEMYEQVLKEDH